MIVNLHIERLVLDGVAGGAGYGARLEAAVQAELTRLYAQAGASALPRSSAAAPVLRGAPLAGQAASNPGRLGSAVAQSIHGVLAK